MVGRNEERARIEQALTGARQGGSAVLVVSGEPGMGKTLLLAHAESEAQRHAMQVLSVRQLESESVIPFVALADLVRPLTQKLAEIPDVQSDVLAGALALGPPVESDRFAVCAATLSLLAAAAEEGPLLACVDDAHWLDPASLEALIFAGRRLSAEGIVLLFATRSGYAVTLESAGFPVMKLAGLEADDARVLLGSEGPIDARVAERLLEETRGNPLALLEAVHMLTADQLAGRLPLDERLPVGPGIEFAFARQLDELSARSRKALLVAAASTTGRLQPIFGALADLDIPRSSLDDAESAGILALGKELVVFRHPLLQSVTYQSARPSDRREAHAALAEHEVSERRAWHLAEAAVGPDESVARALEDAGRAAGQRSGYSAAAAAMDRAAELSVSDEPRTRRQIQAATYFEASGSVTRAADLLEVAFAGTTDPFLRADIQQARGRAEMRRGNFSTAAALLLAEAEAVDSLDHGRASELLCDAVIALTPSDQGSEALQVAMRAVDRAQGAGKEQQVLAEALLDHVLMLRGDIGELGGIALGQLVEHVEASPQTAEPIALGCHVLVWLEQYERARTLVDRAVQRMRALSAVGALPHLLAAKAQLEFRTGHWRDAYAAATESVQLARETGGGDQPFALAYLARIEAAQGRDQACRDHARVAIQVATPLRLLAACDYAHAALGLLELGLGNADAAATELEQCEALNEAYGLREPSVVQSTPDLIEAYVRGGKKTLAADNLARFETEARRTARPWPLAVLYRCRGLLASRSQYAENFEQAFGWHSATDMPFERARTELVYGERLRRDRQRSAARQWFYKALETFEFLGAHPWAARTRSELGASGKTARRRDPDAAEALTPQELQVALVVAAGASNREAASRLFISPRTIDAHLGRIYRKFGIHSRAELASALSSAGALLGDHIL